MRSVALALPLVLAACGAEDAARPAPLELGDVVDVAPIERASVEEGVEEGVESPPSSLAELLAWDAPIHGSVTSAFGQRAEGFHDALDIAAPMGSTVTAPTDLRIRTIAYQARAGRYVIADVVGDDGVVEWRLTFAHLSQVAVFEGDRVPRGGALGLIGLSGSATGAHLHYRVEAVTEGERVAIDPVAVLPSL